MENTSDLSLLFDGSREATVLLRGRELVYQNGAVASLLGELPLSMVLDALDANAASAVQTLELYGHSLELHAQPLGGLTLLRLYHAGERELISPILLAELRDLLFSQELTTRRLLDSLSEQDSDLYGSAVRRSYYGLLNYAERLGDMNQLASGGLVLFPQVFDLVQLFRDVIAALKLMLPSKYPTPVLLSDEPCYVNADGKRMEELLLYLLSNALQHSDKTDSICVRLRNEHGNVLCSVEDSGSGIDSDKFYALFDPAASLWQSGHMSLGLSLAKGIARAHGGSLLIESHSGQGTKVLFSLPAVREPDLPVGECIPSDGIRIIRKTLVNILGLDAYREVFDD